MRRAAAPGNVLLKEMMSAHGAEYISAMIPATNGYENEVPVVNL